jgi:hypothetical protein
MLALAERQKKGTGVHEDVNKSKPLGFGDMVVIPTLAVNANSFVR